MLDETIKSSAVISECGRFRYALTRRWGSGPMALFIMLNPSTADASKNDPTIRRCIGFARREGCGGLRVENLFGFRATDPDIMFRDAHTSIGAADRYIREAAQERDGPVIVAWGADSRAVKRGRAVGGLLTSLDIDPVCLGLSKSGAPKHPLYIKADQPLIAYA